MPKLDLQTIDQTPWVKVTEGAETRIPFVSFTQQLFVLHSRFSPGYTSGRHRHTGPVHVATVSGAWKYVEHDEVIRAGDYLFEPTGSVHTLEVLETNDCPTEFWAIVHGALEYLDHDSRVLNILDARAAWDMYAQACAASNQEVLQPAGWEG
jgi:2,4'-dihydroxyacetophenone dioxygenase